ncbi:MAG: hypothetical protein EA382_16265 [Spirochaetaceae bacterium]|nr:MAG: hypothetical protein EA382_16265 [Spirochaetaceae bacterium]
MTRALDPFVLDLRGVPVRAERTVELVRLVCARGFDPAIDWAGRFPWGVDGRVSSDAYPQEVVAAIDRQARDRGRALLIVMRDPIPVGYSARVSYRTVWKSSNGSDSTLSRLVAKLQSDLIDDAAGLMPTLAGIVAVARSQQRDSAPDPRMRAWESLRDACAASQLSFICADPGLRTAPDFRDDEDFVGGIEERVVLQGLVDGVHIVEAHRALRAWRSDAWQLVGRLHEAVTDATCSPTAADDRLVDSVTRLRLHVRAFPPLVRDVDVAYRRVADSDAVRGHLRRVIAPVREQLSTLAARVSVVRSAR